MFHLCFGYLPFTKTVGVALFISKDLHTGSSIYRLSFTWRDKEKEKEKEKENKKILGSY
jgi:hypothetical protein